MNKPSNTILLLLICLIANGLAVAQKAVLSGSVTDSETKEKLPGVSVVVDDSTGTVTGMEGTFTYNVTEGRHKVEFRYVGYETQKMELTFKTDETKTMNISLKNSAKELGTVVVSASKFEQKLSEVVVSMEVIKPKDLESSNRVDMEEAMNHVPGVTVIDGQANIRGGSGFSYGAGSRVMVMVDDLPLLAADANDVKWSFIPIENMEQIEVIKGASSALFGSSAMNGVINLRTAYPKSEPETKVSIFSSWYDDPKDSRKKWWTDNTSLFSTGFTFNHSRKINQFDLSVGGQALKDDGYRKGEDETRGRINLNTRYHFKKIDGLSAGVNVNFQQSNGALFLIWSNDTSGALVPLGDGSTANTLSSYLTTRAYIDPYITYFGKNNTSHKFRYRNFLTDNKNNTNQESRADANYLDYQFQKKFENNLTVTAGAFYNYNKVKSELYGDHHSDNMSLYAQGDWKHKKLNASLGARIERNTIDSITDNVVPVFRAGLNYAIAKATNIRASFGQGYRFPSIAEMFVKTEVGAVKIFPSDSLTPEKGWTAEIGIQQGFKFSGILGYVDIAAFYQRYTNMMEFTFGSWSEPPELGFKSINVGNIKIPGVDLTLVLNGTIGQTRWTVMSGYTYIPVEVDSSALDKNLTTSNNEVLKYRYKHTYKGNLEVGWKKMNLGVSTQYYSFMENIDEAFTLLIVGVNNWRVQHPDGNWIWDTYFRYDFDNRISASFIVKNLTNHEWTDRPSNMQPMRQFTFQFLIKV